MYDFDEAEAGTLWVWDTRYSRRSTPVFFYEKDGVNSTMIKPVTPIVKLKKEGHWPYCATTTTFMMDRYKVLATLEDGRIMTGWISIVGSLNPYEQLLK